MSRSDPATGASLAPRPTPVCWPPRRRPHRRREPPCPGAGCAVRAGAGPALPFLEWTSHRSAIGPGKRAGRRPPRPSSTQPRHSPRRVRRSPRLTARRANPGSGRQPGCAHPGLDMAGPLARAGSGSRATTPATARYRPARRATASAASRNPGASTPIPCQRPAGLCSSAGRRPARAGRDCLGRSHGSAPGRSHLPDATNGSR